VSAAQSKKALTISKPLIRLSFIVNSLENDGMKAD
jgi:hypothetical protein